MASKRRPKEETAKSKRRQGADGPNVVRIVLTGGPCGGKTTALSILRDRVEALGYKCFCVPEAATLLIGSGVSFGDLSQEQILGFQEQLLQTIIQLENAIVTIATSYGQNAVVLCDRGTMDCMAYMKKEEWQGMLDELNWTDVRLRDARYEAVIHLRTAAAGAEAFYTLENNPSRTETPEQARAIDDAIIRAWTGHPQLTVVNNNVDFATKMSMAVEAVVRHLGQSIQSSEQNVVKRKWLVAAMEDTWPVSFTELDVEHHFLESTDGSELRVRKRGNAGSFVYSSRMTRYMDGFPVITRSSLTPREYVATLRRCRKDVQPVHAKRRSFIWKHQYFELDVYQSPRSGLMLLEAFVGKNNKVDLPTSFLELVEEVTDKKEYSLVTTAGWK